MENEDENKESRILGIFGFYRFGNYKEDGFLLGELFFGEEVFWVGVGKLELGFGREGWVVLWCYRESIIFFVRYFYFFEVIVFFGMFFSCSLFKLFEKF